MLSFDSRPLWGERRNNGEKIVKNVEFQFTLPCGERLLKHKRKIIVWHISIHAPIMERQHCINKGHLVTRFQFSLPYRERLHREIDQKAR